MYSDGPWTVRRQQQLGEVEAHHHHRPLPLLRAPRGLEAHGDGAAQAREGEGGPHPPLYSHPVEGPGLQSSAMPTGPDLKLVPSNEKCLEPIWE